MHRSQSFGKGHPGTSNSDTRGFKDKMKMATLSKGSQKFLKKQEKMSEKMEKEMSLNRNFIEKVFKEVQNKV